MLQTQLRESSLEAHEIIKPHKETHYEIIKNAMEKICEPATSKQISHHTMNVSYKGSYHSLNYHDVAKRLSEMERKEMIKVVGRAYNIPKRPLLWKLNK